MRNVLLSTDVYKMGHMEQYPKNLRQIYSYLTARSSKVMDKVLFYGLQPCLKMLEQPITHGDVAEFLDYREALLGRKASIELMDRLAALVELQYIPLHIKAVEEGTLLPVRNVLMTITNTHPDFAWVVGFFESLLLKVWYPSTVATYSHRLRQMCELYAAKTCDNNAHVPFQVHDFGYRGCSSEETAELGGSAHLVNFLGTDTVPALKFIKNNYGCSELVGLSVPATEHSVMCAWGKADELNCFRHLINSVYPKGIVSIVSDTWNLWRVLTEFVSELKSEIMVRWMADTSSKVVFRPDSGDPELIICGNPNGSTEEEKKGALQLLWETFGGTVNSKGFRVLHPSVGLIYGDGFTPERFHSVFAAMVHGGWATSNLVVGIGGLLLQSHSRDTQGYAIKATYAEYSGAHGVGSMDLQKDPITDSGKRSLTGLLQLERLADGEYVTHDRCNKAQEDTGLLKTVFKDGWINATSFDDIRKRAWGTK